MFTLLLGIYIIVPYALVSTFNVTNRYVGVPIADLCFPIDDHGQEAP